MGGFVDKLDMVNMVSLVVIGNIVVYIMVEFVDMVDKCKVRCSCIADTLLPRDCPRVMKCCMAMSYQNSKISSFKIILPPHYFLLIIGQVLLVGHDVNVISRVFLFYIQEKVSVC